MARVRQARRCRAKRTDGSPCRAWAISGGFVCRAHGGATWNARIAAQRRLEQASINRAMQGARARYERDRQAWLVQLVILSAEHLGIPMEDLTRADLRIYRITAGWHGWPLPPEPVMRSDRRYGRRTRPNWWQG